MSLATLCRAAVAASLVAGACVTGAATAVAAPATAAVAALPTPPVHPLYITPGTHSVNGREWRTRCEPYGTAARCFTDIVASWIARTPTGYAVRTGWVRNNLTYRDWDGPAWRGNLLATPGTHTSAGRSWRVTCATAPGGWRTCRSSILTTAITRQLVGGRYVYRTAPSWKLNNIVWLKSTATSPTVPVSPTPTPPPPMTPPSGPLNITNPGDTKNCSDFATWGAANYWFEQVYAYFGDVAHLDPDNDMVPCEDLPGAPGGTP